MSTVVALPTNRIHEDLVKSGITLDFIRARPIGPTERHATGTPQQVEGYAIPYFDINEKVTPFYRVRLFDWTPKYRQVANQPNHIYFPPGFVRNLEKAKCIIITEGEKKAACASAFGYAACAVSGVDSWRNRILSMPKDSKLQTSKDGRVLAKLPSGQETVERTESVAQGLVDLIALSIARNLPLVIVYDTDVKEKVNTDVQAAAAQFGYELRFRGVPAKNIRQMHLKPGVTWLEDKIGLDDFLVDEKLGPKIFDQQLEACLKSTSAFPRHPNPRAFVNKKLLRGRIPRNEMQALSTAILCDLDAKGVRLRCPDDEELYYFSRQTHTLTKVDFHLDAGFSKKPFGVMMYREYNITPNDNNLLTLIGSQYSGEEPVLQVSPERVMAVKGDNFYLQISNGHMAKVNKSGIFMLENGQEDILFESDSVVPIDRQKLMEHIAKYQQMKELPHLWYEVIKQARIRESEEDRDRKVLALLYCLSPWFYKWRQTQLPIEMMIGEPGSGKSTLFALRLNIMTGKAKLRNSPKDLRDWTASVAGAGGLHATDNVHMGDTMLRQELSDELCRVVTASRPMIERRKLYSDNELVETQVKCVFALTAVRQPFQNADIIQRSIITNLYKGAEEVEFENRWEDVQMEKYGGREGWLAWHIVFMHKFFGVIQEHWDHNYKSKYRLINVEQLLVLAAKVFGEDGSWVPEYLNGTQKKLVAEADWAMGGIKAWADDIRASAGWKNGGKEKLRFYAKDIVAWVEGNDDYEGCNILKNSRSLGNWMKDKTNQLATIAGVVHKGKYANAECYAVKEVKE